MAQLEKPDTVLHGGDVSFTELHAHWCKLQSFMQTWGAQQERLLRSSVGMSSARMSSNTSAGTLSSMSSAQDTAVKYEGGSSQSLRPEQRVSHLGSGAVYMQSSSTTNHLYTAGRALKRAATGAVSHPTATPAHAVVSNEPIQAENACPPMTLGTAHEDPHEPLHHMSDDEDEVSKPAMTGSSNEDADAGSQSRGVSGIERSGAAAAAMIANRPASVRDLVSRQSFDVLCGLVISVNAIVIGMASDYAIKHPLNPTNSDLEYAETSFLIFYVIEIGMRLYVKGCRKYFREADWAWNVFDAVLVVQGILETLYTYLEGEGAFANLSFLRLLRLMKMLKLLRMVRLLRAFRELRLIVSAISGALSAMFWAGMLILSIAYMFGIVFIQACSTYLQTEGSGIDTHTRDAIAKYWSSVSQGILSLYMATMGGEDWAVIAQPLLEVGSGCYGLFIIYIAIFAFVVINIITSLFLESILNNADKDHQLVIEMQLEQKHDYVAALKRLYSEMDSDGNGEITWEEFLANLESPHMHAFASSLDIDITDAKQFFQVLSDRGTRSVDIETFVVGCIKLKGAAKSSDLMELSYNHKEDIKIREKHSKEIHKIQTDSCHFRHAVFNDFQKMFDHLERIYCKIDCMHPTVQAPANALREQTGNPLLSADSKPSSLRL